MKSSMYVALVLLLGILVYGVYAYARTAHYVQKSSVLVANAEVYNTQKDGGGADMLVIGDSTAVGVGTVSDQSVPAVVAKALGMTVENHAQSGATVHEVHAQLLRASQEQYAFILIQAGANDIMSFRSPASIEADMRELLREATAHSDRVVLLTAGDVGGAPMWPFPLSTVFSYRTKQIRELALRVTEALGVAYIDLYALPDPFNSNPKRYYADDFLHLSADGYAVWAQYVLETVHSRWPEL